LSWIPDTPYCPSSEPGETLISAFGVFCENVRSAEIRVLDLDPDPLDLYVFGLPDPSLFCTDLDPDPDPSINKQIEFFSVKTDVMYLQKVKSKKT
jgi:hypothetical protein